MNGRRGGERWWLSGGTQQCGECLAWYGWEVRVHCADCDAPLCPLCAVTLDARGAVVCPTCESADGARLR